MKQLLKNDEEVKKLNWFSKMLTSNTKWILILLTILSVSSIISIWLYSSEIISKLFYTHQEKVTFGDQFDAINSLFSGLAFAGIIITVLLQSRELSLQRKELKQTREVFNQQKFETTFFQLLNLNQSNLAHIQYKTSMIQGNKTTSRRMSSGSNAIFDYYNSYYLNKIPIGKNMDIENHRKHSIKFFEELHPTFQTYIASIKNSLNFIYLSNIINKEIYIDLLSGQLTDFDKILIFHFILDDNHIPLRVKCVKSGILEGVSDNNLFHNETHRELYHLTIAKS